MGDAEGVGVRLGARANSSVGDGAGVTGGCLLHAAARIIGTRISATATSLEVFLAFPGPERSAR